MEENIEQSKSDYCLYVRIEPGKTIYVIVWVDDIIVASSNLEEVQELKKITGKTSNWKKEKNEDGS